MSPPVALLLILHGYSNFLWLQKHEMPIAYSFEGAHSEEVGHHSREAGCQATLCDETEFQLG